jgi:hypothetical protein
VLREIPQIFDDAYILVVFWRARTWANNNSGKEGEEREKFRDGESVIFDDIDSAVGYGLLEEGSEAERVLY